jgi:hypothetical protein
MVGRRRSWKEDDGASKEGERRRKRGERREIDRLLLIVGNHAG